MATLQDFDQALADSEKADGATWVDGVLHVGALAAKLSDEELALLRVIWPGRPLLWQKHCADVLDQARRGEALELLMDMLDRSGPDVTLAALESLSKFNPALFAPAQTTRILAASDAALARPGGTAAPALAREVSGQLAVSRSGRPMMSGGGTLAQGTLRPLEPSGGRRRLAPADLLQLLDPRPSRRTLSLARGDEGLQLDAGELGQVGAGRLPGKRGTLHAVYFAHGVMSGKCRSDMQQTISGA